MPNVQTLMLAFTRGGPLLLGIDCYWAVTGVIDQTIAAAINSIAYIIMVTLYQQKMCIQDPTHIFSRPA